MTDIVPDTLVDARYKILTRIGSGGMADVFCAEDQQLGRKVALKLLHRRFASDPEFVERFRREASSAAGLSHPNVVAVYDRGEWDGTSYIAMEYLPGRTLKDVIRQEAPIEPVRAIDFTLQILKAARFAHRRGIIHRDLKPHNVMVDDEDRARVTDFGIARAGASDMTETGSIIGTAQYLSPEQAQGLAVSPVSDLYSVGVILFELLTGELPFDAEAAVSIALKHVSEQPPAPSALNPAVPEGLDAIVLWALEKDPDRRPQDADAFIVALEQVREQLVAAEAPGQRTAMLTPPIVVDPQAYGPPSGAYETVPPDYGEHPSFVHEPQPGRRPPWWVWLLAALALAGVGLGVWALTRPDEVVIPGVVGSNVGSATRTLEARGFTVTVRRVTNDAPVDRVLKQSPTSGVEAKKGSEVRLQASAGPGQTNVPSVDGQPLATARAEIEKAGLRVAGTRRRSSATIAAGNVIGADPASGASVDRGSDVTLTVSTGPQTIPVPNLVGFTESDARRALVNDGFVPVVTTAVTGDRAKVGTVLQQSPRGRVPPGATIALTVGRAPPRIAVPDVGGQSAIAAEQQLANDGFEVRRSERAVTDPAQEGVVVAQKPPVGTLLDRGAPVRILIGRFTQPITPTTPTTPTTPGSQTTPTTTPGGA
jgi:serine/threonine protein kinase/beta-lactam-binding protein with PASTA domain